MTSPNSNYVAGITGFSAANFYEADSVGEFNSGLNAFSASCLFWLGGEYQSSAAVDAVPQFLWGNADDPAFLGWSLRIVDGTAFGLGGDAKDAFILATLGDGAAFAVAAAPLSNVGGEPAAGYCERLIQASIWFEPSTQSVVLGVNGQIAAHNFGGVDPAGPAASAQAPRMGCAPAPNLTDDAATAARIVACTYQQGFPLVGANLPGVSIGLSFRAARAQNSGSFLSAPNSIDWRNRWEANSISGQGAILKSAAGAALVSFPVAPASLADVGNRGVDDASFYGANPPNVPMTRNGDLFVDSEKNVDWYAGNAFAFAGVPP